MARLNPVAWATAIVLLSFGELGFQDLADDLWDFETNQYQINEFGFILWVAEHTVPSLLPPLNPRTPLFPPLPASTPTPPPHTFSSSLLFFLENDE
jgi:hypothetical protein